MYMAQERCFFFFSVCVFVCVGLDGSRNARASVCVAGVGVGWGGGGGRSRLPHYPKYWPLVEFKLCVLRKKLIRRAIVIVSTVEI